MQVPGGDERSRVWDAGLRDAKGPQELGCKVPLGRAGVTGQGSWGTTCGAPDAVSLRAGPARGAGPAVHGP